MQTAYSIDDAVERPGLPPEFQILALDAASGHTDIRSCGPLTMLLRDRPSVVVASTSGFVFAAVAYRLVRRRSRLMIWSERPAPPWRLLRRLALRLADVVLVRGEPELSRLDRSAGHRCGGLRGLRSL